MAQPSKRVLSFAESYRARLDEDHAFQILRRMEAPLYLAILDTLFDAPEAKIPASELESSLSDLLRDIPPEAVANFFPAGETRDVKRIASDLYGRSVQGYYGWLEAVHDESDQRDYYKVSESAVDAREYLRRRPAARAYNKASAKTFDDLIDEAFAVVSGDDSERDYCERQIEYYEQRLKSLGQDDESEDSKTQRIADLLNTALNVSADMPSSVRRCAKTLRTQSRKMEKLAREGYSCSEARREEQKAWERACSDSSFSAACEKDARRVLGKASWDDLCMAVKMRPEYVDLNSDLKEVGETYQALRAALNDFGSALSERNNARERVVDISLNPRYREDCQEAAHNLSLMAYFIQHLHKGQSTWVMRTSDGEEVFYPVAGDVVEEFTYREGLSSLNPPKAADPVPAVPPSEEDMRRMVARLKRRGSPSPQRAARTVLAYAVRDSEGKVDIPASLARAGEHALCQDIVPLMARCHTEGDAVVWRITDADGNRLAYKGVPAAASIEELVRMRSEEEGEWDESWKKL